MQANATAREQELFCGCLDLPPSERTAWLQSACCGDTQLKRRIERLLAAHAEAERLCIDDAAYVEHVDRYRIVRVVGQGGMGVVYEAMQEEPLRRKVALKAIRPGMDTAEVLARFRMERQALASMEHPHIAKVFDAGHTPSGRPYFVMEFVDGSPILKYCEQNALTLRQRLELFVLICHAVQHAHHKGVIHRDLKPGNILVTDRADAPAPRIIDFGIARAITGDLGRGVTQTDAGARPGTPAYMSPEQAGYRGLDVDTRSDIYSLGVILYELLTGRLPADDVQVGSVEFLRRLSAGELEIRPPRLLARRHRSAAIPTGDLDAIVLKALDTDRDRRYPTALAFAQDLQRYLDGRPVSAYPPTILYRAQKFWQRRRIQAISATIAMAALATGIGAGTYGLLQARRAEAEAREEAATARHIAEFLTNLFTLADPNRTPGSPMTVPQVLAEGTRRVQAEMTSMPHAQAELLSTLAHVHESIGSYATAKALAERSLALQKAKDDIQTAETLLTLGRSAHRLGQFDEARDALSRAIALRNGRAGNTIEVASALNLLGAVDGQLERFAEAESAHRRALAIQEQLKGPHHIATYNSWRGLGILYGRQGRHAEALQAFEKVLPIARKRYGEEHPIVADAMHNIATELCDLGRYREAETVYTQALGTLRKLLGPDHPTVAFTAAGLGHVYRKQGRYREAEQFFRDAVRIRELALGENNIRTQESRKSLGLVRLAAGAVDEGYDLVVRAIAGMEQLYGAKHTEVLAAHRDAGIALAQAGRYAQSVPHLARVSGPDTPARVRVDLRDPVFDGLRHSSAMSQLIAARPQVASGTGRD